MSAIQDRTVSPIKKRQEQRVTGEDEPNTISLAGSNLGQPVLTPRLDRDNILGRTPRYLARPGRSPSPTKGLGGFVESAMMKRSDSVNKRWSVRANAGLKRGDSVAGSRPVFQPPTATSQTLGHARTISREPRSTLEGTSSPLSSSRPSSSHEVESRTLSKPLVEAQEEMRPPSKPVSIDRPPTPSDESSLSRSPSKTLDPRRWSPTKASWLESALSKPESPKPTTAKTEVPAWKADMQRSRSQKDLQGSPQRPQSTFEPVSTEGLLRSPRPGTETKPLHISGASMRGSPSKKPEEHREKSIADTNRSQISHEYENSSPSALPEVAATTENSDSIRQPQKKHSPQEMSSNSAEDTPVDGDSSPGRSPKHSQTASVDKKPPAVKPKPQTPPKTDFRSALKSRPTGTSGTGNNEPEFRSVFGKLKPTQTQNFVAPDIFKDNITRGKAALNVTGGPQKTKRVDEFKESI